MNLLSLWPTEQNILDCIKPEAENPQDAVFLAVHQPMKLQRRRFGSDQEQDGTEQDLLDDFLKKDLPTGTLLIPILGNSGIGKSHLVRWLDVQLRQRSDKHKRHVIRIPKSSSLKTVLRRILDGLEGERFDTIRRQLESSRERMDQIGATERIRAELLAAIRRRTELAMSRKENARRNGGAVDPEDERWIGHGDRRYLPAFLSDPITSRMLMETHAGRTGIVAELARHLTEDSTPETVPRRQFEEADFLIPTDLQKEIGSDSGVPARRYLQELDKFGGKGRAEATTLLNEIIDDAIQPLAAPTDTSLSELFYAVRCELLTEGRELVLLVEDFAVLAGIQGALLDAMIREGVRGGHQEACVMRTALAVTEGYLTSFETVRTRAGYAWYIKEIPTESESQTINRICDFVGGYLNAARFGAAELQKYIQTASKDLSWVPDFTDHETLTEIETKQVGAFGHSPSGRALFPLNRSAIATIADWKMRDSGHRLKFNPRAIINELLIPVLREYRIQFERGEFPPDWFLGYETIEPLEPVVRSQVRERVKNPQDQKRIYALLRFWGEKPRDLSQVQLPKLVYEAFRLPPISEPSSRADVDAEPKPVIHELQQPTRQPELQQKKVESTPTSTPERAPERTPELEPPEVRAWIERIEKWSHGQDLIQRDALMLRKIVVDHIIAMIDWDAELLRPLEKSDYLSDWVYLPASKGASQCNPTNAFVVLASDEEFSVPDTQERIVLGLRALVRYHHHKTWNFDRSEEEFPRYAILLESLAKQAVRWLHASYRKIDGDAVLALTESLMIGGRLLNVATAHSREDAALVDCLFQEPSSSPPQGESAWDDLRTKCFDNRTYAKDELLARIGVRQGGAKQVFAVDSSRLLEIIRSVKNDWTMKSPFPTHRSDELSIKQIESHCKDLARRLQSATSKRKDEIVNQWNRIRIDLGDDFSKQQLVDDLNKVLHVTKQFGVADAQDKLGDLSKLVETFQDAAVSQCLQHVRRIGEEPEGGALLSALAQVDDTTLSLVARFVNEMRGFLDRTETNVKGHLAVLGNNIVESAIERIDTQLKSIQHAIPKPSGGGK